MQFCLTQFTGSTNDTVINISARINPIIYNGQFYWMPANGTNISTTNGFGQVTLVPSQYNVSFANNPQSWTITVTNSATALNDAGLTTSTLIYSGINSLTGNVVTNDHHGNYSINLGTAALLNTNNVVQYNAIDGNGGYQFAEGNDNFFTGAGGNASDLSGNGAGNIAIGIGALTSPGTYDGNDAIGLNALDSLITGGFNTAMGGDGALPNLISGNYNTAIGVSGTGPFGQDGAGYAYTGGESYNVLLANKGVSGESYTMRLGALQTNTFIAGVIHGNAAGETNQNVANLASGNTSSSNNWVGTFNGPVIGNGGGLTGVQGYNLSGQIVQQNDVTFQTIQTNTSWTAYGAFGNTNWYGYTISGNTYGGAYSLTNSPYFSFWSGYLSNYLVFGALNTLVPYVDPGPSGAAYVPQGPSLRIKTQFIGQQIGMLSGGGGQFFWSSDDLAGSPKAWTYTNLNNANIISSVFTWPNVGLHTLELHFVGCGLAGLFLPVTNSFVPTQKPYETGIMVGDSIVGGTGTVSGCPGADSWAGYLQDKLMPLGISIIPQGEGATGYVATNIVGSQITGLPVIQRLTNCILSFHPNFIVWEPSINDPTNLLYSAATNVFLLTKSYLPNCIQLVIGTPPAIVSAPGSSTPSDLIMSNAAAACGLPVLLPEPSAADSWIQGSYNVPGSGTAYTYYSGRNGGPGGPHPNPAGHYAYAQLSIDFIISHLTTNTTPILW